ncbi:hypothetical protein PNK_1008 [Candidatus Protochlamydia naegleriophila]|uniref:Uncharacterized protein n=1 Tax=Candidatus Protochlamydia naegleriophila TaxID=389348 RepID=A0A0U5JBY2_9BACT|nr:hypothetical protein [Candidatus Protochlamydia naegleriophila]CUI16631.1 hypothetical protein PNK_1008 [Candidatus Protochlamydia naegleriophila]
MQATNNLYTGSISQDLQENPLLSSSQKNGQYPASPSLILSDSRICQTNVESEQSVQDFHIRKPGQEQLTRLRTYLCSFHPLHNASLPCRINYYLALNEEGEIVAISTSNKTMSLRNHKNELKEINSIDWKIQLLIHAQFIQMGMLDGDFPFNSAITLKIIHPLSEQQWKAAECLQHAIDGWLDKTAQASDLDLRIVNTLKSKIKTQRGAVLTPKIKAYFLLLRELLTKCCLIKEQGILLPPKKRGTFTSHSSS